VAFWEGLPAAVMAECKWCKDYGFIPNYFNLGNM